jgi:hypothetical protein
MLGCTGLRALETERIGQTPERGCPRNMLRKFKVQKVDGHVLEAL